jgi:hypothetical protein
MSDGFAKLGLILICSGGMCLMIAAIITIWSHR